MEFRLRPIYAAITALYNNYNHHVDIAENRTQAEKAEEDHFMDEVFKSPIIRELHQFLGCKGMLSVRFTG